MQRKLYYILLTFDNKINYVYPSIIDTISIISLIRTNKIITEK